MTPIPIIALVIISIFYKDGIIFEENIEILKSNIKDIWSEYQVKYDFQMDYESFLINSWGVIGLFIVLLVLIKLVSKRKKGLIR